MTIYSIFLVHYKITIPILQQEDNQMKKWCQKKRRLTSRLTSSMFNPNFKNHINYGYTN